jgi:hypothetical protein
MTLTLCEIKVTPTSVIDRRSQGGISASVIRRSLVGAIDFRLGSLSLRVR